MVSEKTMKVAALVTDSLQKSGINDKDLLDLIELAQIAILDEGDRDWGLQVTDYVKKCKMQFYKGIRDAYFEDELFWSALKVEAQNRVVDSYFLYLEKNRDYKDMFYLPRRKCFIQHGIIQGYQDILDDKLDILGISMPPGTGKGELPSAKILTPSGFTTFGQIKVGDKVIAANGKVAKVIGVYPRPSMPIYKFIFDDRSSVICSQDHVWHVKTRDDRNRGNDYRNIETSQMLKNFRVENGKRANYSIPYVRRIEGFEKQDLAIHPYVLGALIGDGCITDTHLKITSPDKELLDKFEGLLPSGFELKHISRYDYGIKCNASRSVLNSALKQYGLLGKHSHEKFIPKCYLYSSHDERLELLRGLLDTDGCVTRCCIEYSTASEQLAQDVCELVHSLGGYCSINKATNCGYRKDGEFIKCRDAYRLLIEFSKDAENPFTLSRKADKYNPKRQLTDRYITDIQYVGEAETICIKIDDPSHLYITDDYIITHNTTGLEFLNTGVIGWFPRDYSLFYSHSGDITKMYYDSAYNIVSDETEYTWREIFPKLKVTSTNAKSQQFNVGSFKAFPSLQTASVGSKNAGKVRASKLLLTDDLVGGLEEALNKNILDKLWRDYAVDARQRKTKDSSNKMCKEIVQATRWSTIDILGRLEAAYEDNERVRFIRIPDIDPITGESNFQYEMGGFTVEDFEDQAKLMDDISYRCLYKQEPVEREGLLYPEEDLKRYLELPEREPDAILGICDTKGKGTDYMFLPCFYQYNDDYYLVDCICSDNANYEVQYQNMVNLIAKHNMQQIQYESNRDGDRVAYEVSKRLQETGSRCNITTKYTTQNKETKIIVNSDWVKKHCIFKDKSMYSRNEDYGTMMHFLLSHTIAGKAKHDDVVDGLASFALYVTGGQTTVAKIIRSPF